MGLIEKYNISEAGYHPFLIQDVWQVAKLNYSEERHIDQINYIKIHQKSDRAFALLKGNAVLIAIDDIHKKSCFEVKLMQTGTSYNIPKNIGYAIAMQKGSEVFIVEKANAHIEDVDEHPLSEEQRQHMKSNVNKEFKK